MASLLSTLFASRDDYLANHILEINKDNSFPMKHKISYGELISGLGNDSVLVTGGTNKERSLFLLGVLKSLRGKVVLLHNGNSFFKADYIRRCGMAAEEWDDNIYKDMNKSQIISLLSGEKEDNELLFFYAYAFEVCEVLGIPVSIEGIKSIDWLNDEWQQELLRKPSQRDRAHDLLRRFDKQMAESAVKAMGRTERLSRTRGINHGVGIRGVLESDILLTKEVHGSTSLVTKQCFEAVQALAESGVQLTLVLDDVFLPDVAMIKDNLRNIRLVFAANDISQLTSDMHLTNRECSVIVFKHKNYKSAKIISETYFGEYDKLENDLCIGQSKSFMSPATYNKAMTIRRGRDLRLKPEYIAKLPRGLAFVSLVDGQEGIVRLL